MSTIPGLFPVDVVYYTIVQYVFRIYLDIETDVGYFGPFSGRHGLSNKIPTYIDTETIVGYSRPFC
ncbi:hypothetical protein J6590_003230 [Homalodisca vitripennis]|nr:hypothetical protein J6590_003230 [Homalodisca vitripennis]